MIESALFALVLLLAVFALWARRTTWHEDEDEAADARLRFVLFRPSGNTFTIDAVVDAEGASQLGEAGSVVTLRIARQPGSVDSHELEALLRQWAAEDRLVDVTLAADRSISSMRAHGSPTRLRLVA